LINSQYCWELTSKPTLPLWLF